MAGDNQKMIDNFNNMPIEELENIVENYYTDKSDEYEMEAIKTAERILKQRRGEKLKPEIKIEDSTREVHLTGINMPFDDMVIFIFKWTIASIPTAMFIYGIVYLIINYL